MWVIGDKSGSLLANTGDLAYMEVPLIIAEASSILDVRRGPVFKYPCDGGKKLPLTECFERNKIAQNVCLFTVDSTSISVLLINFLKLQ